MAATRARPLQSTILVWCLLFLHFTVPMSYWGQADPAGLTPCCRALAVGPIANPLHCVLVPCAGQKIVIRLLGDRPNQFSFIHSFGQCQPDFLTVDIRYAILPSPSPHLHNFHAKPPEPTLPPQTSQGSSTQSIPPCIILPHLIFSSLLAHSHTYSGLKTHCNVWQFWSGCNVVLDEVRIMLSVGRVK